MFDVWVRGKFRRCRSGHFYPEKTIKVSLYFFTQVLNTRQDLEVVSACLRNASGELSFLEEGVTAAMQLRGKQTGRPSCPNSRTLCRQKIMGKQQTTNLSVRKWNSKLFSRGWTWLEKMCYQNRKKETTLLQEPENTECD